MCIRDRAAFAGINARGGVHGKAIELVTQDDTYDVPKALANVEQFLADPGYFALFNCCLLYTSRCV